MRNQEAAAVVLLDDELEADVPDEPDEEELDDEPESEGLDDEPLVLDEDEDDRLSVR